MDEFTLLMDGFSAALTFENILFAFVGVMLGTFIGALPGFGPTAGIALLLPLVFIIPPTGGLIMLGAIYYGNMYGNTISSVLLNLPGDAAAVATTFDGYQMAKNGEAGIALGIAAVGSFLAGTIAVILLTVMGPTVASWAIGFGPAENFCLIVIGLMSVAGLTGDMPLKGYTMAVLGSLLALIGMDTISFQTRLTFGMTELMSGIDFIPIVLGFFGLAEILDRLSAGNQKGSIIAQRFRLRDVWPKMKHFKQSWAAMLRGSFLGFFIGILPGAGASVASFLSYALEKKVSKHPEKFGKGALEGVAGPEAANNSAAIGGFVPMLSLGIPGSATTTVLLAALIMWGMRPGPLLYQEHPDVIWAFVASQYTGNMMLLVVNILLIPVFVWMLKVSSNYLTAIVGVLAIIGVYSINYDVFDIWAMLVFAFIGFVLRKENFPLAPLVLAFVLTPLAEESLRQALTISGGSVDIFVGRPVSAFLLMIIATLALFGPVSRRLRKRYRVEEEA